MISPGQKQNGFDPGPLGPDDQNVFPGHVDVSVEHVLEGVQAGPLRFCTFEIMICLV